MIKLLWWFLILVAAALGFAWLADRPGNITIIWLGREIHMSVLVGVVLLGLVLLAVYFIWKLTHKIWRSPATARDYLRFRKHRKAYDSLSRGIIAAGAGDAQAAARHAAIAADTLKHEPLIALLAAQSAQLKGDRASVKRAFEEMTQSPETELLGLRGLFAEAKQAGDWAAARGFADRALAKNSRLPWAATAVLQVQTTAKDWQAAARNIAAQAKAGLLPREQAAKKQASLLTAQAMLDEETNRESALANATEALSLDAALVPAALVAARCYVASDNPRKALKVLRNIWAVAPHAELAEVAAHAKAGDGPEVRFERVRDLVGKPELHIEAAVGLARAALAAKRFDVAKAALESFVTERPQQRVCALMAEIEDAQGDAGRSREWLARALHAPRDPIWVSDGVASLRWVPISPVTGEIVPCEWKAPFDVIEPPAPIKTQELVLTDAKTSEPKILETMRPPDDPGID